MTHTPSMRPRDRDAVIQSMRAGVVPRRGQHLIQVGRAAELAALVADIDRVAGEGATIRLVIGDYGSGKTFFLHLVRAIALQKRLVAIHADLSPERRLHSTGGHARSLYSELMRNMATRSAPDGGALPSVVERFVTTALQEASARSADPAAVMRERLGSLTEMVGGYDFAHVLECYWRGHDTGNDALKNDAIRWLRGEFTARTDARRALGVRTIVDDENVYDQLKLLGRFVRLAGYGGMLICLDEMVNLYKLGSGQARTSNYEQILRILNDTLQGIATGIGFVLCGTPEFLSDTRRGLYSYAALQSRLSDNRFATDGRRDLTGPVIRLGNLTPEDLYVLLGKVRHVYAGGDSTRYLIPDEALTKFMEHCSTRIGEAYFRTPRTTIREFVNLLAVLEQNPNASWKDLIGDLELGPDTNPDLAPLDGELDERAQQGDGEFTTFKL
ncbi:MAG: ATP-binding protein [bacterium]|nr:ATP-binding protein [bacterium]